MRESVNLAQRLFIDTTGEIYPITTLIDVEGDITDDPADARVVVAGRDHRWFCIDLSEFENVSTQ